MVTDDERREVAARLRKAIGLTEFAEVLGFNWTDDSDWVWNDVSNLVADLIEPSCDRDAPQKVAEEMFGKMRHSTKEEADAYDAMLKSKSVELHPVDREALLDMEDEMFESATGLALISELEEDADLKDLQTTMAKVLFGYARRIREALGVES